MVRLHSRVSSGVEIEIKSVLPHMA
ncbi:hypothetical protein F383_00501 [Gossypium arboreum]|uniref:Uncharacterized protein n=1 Tax=Gossypium arboreum TaxID=29729 RepID=A0A0B0N8L1_GOSAR|nr:hypothetical protein F383_00501 [Gossypium arboreum]